MTDTDDGRRRYDLTLVAYGRWTYGPWHIEWNEKPIATTACDFDWWHDDFDGAPDAGDSRCGSERNLDACVAAIHDREDDQ